MPAAEFYFLSLLVPKYIFSRFYCSLFQYLTNIDESPAKMGGKENYWRKLTLDGML